MEFLMEQIFKQVPLNVFNLILAIAILVVQLKVTHPWLRKVDKSIEKLADQVAVTNGSVKTLIQWKEDHTNSDDQRHKDNQGVLGRMADSLRDLVNWRKP